MSDVTASPMEILLKRFKSFKPPTLKGTENSVECEDDRRIRLIGYQLQDVAKSWWITTKKALENQDKNAEFTNLKLGNLTIEEYVATLSTLLKFAPHVAENEEAKADQFINGLNPDVFTLVNAGRLNNFADALD
ncbi:uncharacterized protein [Henckelia pumila]|uniref:uncharacterized protein n=1 Tax=Henckelia pumila TaxID=405737 RepID=UPI003C6E9369